MRLHVFGHRIWENACQCYPVHKNISRATIDVRSYRHYSNYPLLHGDNAGRKFEIDIRFMNAPDNPPVLNVLYLPLKSDCMMYIEMRRTKIERLYEEEHLLKAAYASLYDG